MRPANFDLTIYCGTTLDAEVLRFTYKVGGVPVDLTGFVGRCSAKGQKGWVFNTSTENGQLTLGGASGQITLNFTAAETSAMWKPGLTPANREGTLYFAGTWDLEIESADGRVQRLLEGRVLLSPEVSP